MKKILLFASLFAISIGANAALFQGDSSAVFENAAGPAGMVTTGQGTNQFTWGQGAYSHSTGFLFWKQNHYHNPSKLGYSGTGFNVDAGTQFSLGTLSFYNGIINAGTEATSVDFALTLDFSAPSSFGETFTHNFGLMNTPNPQGDSVSLLNSAPSYFYSYEGNDYYFELLGFKSGDTILSEIFLDEGKFKKYQLIGQFTALPSEVPLPAAVWLFGSGLMGFMAIRRRAKSQQA